MARVRLCQDDLTYISVGHRPSLLDYHDTKLRLKNGGYSVEPIEETLSRSSEMAAL
jgi:ABC-type uncharacterized transport system fused permease/ATPase subunit